MADNTTNTNSRVFFSYKSLFSIKYKIYTVGEKALPRPIPLDAVAVFAALLVPCLLLGRLVGPLFGLSPAVAGFGLDLAVTALCFQVDPQGRALPLFLADLAAFAFRPKRRSFGGGVLRTARGKADWRVVELD